MICQRMELGEPGQLGPAAPGGGGGLGLPIDVDTVALCAGTTANPIIAQTTPA
jgi:hypothetical protein